jgi:SAM-dependent methyltransferase
MTVDIRSFLSSSTCFNAFNWIVGSKRCRSFYTDRYIRPKPGDRVLDLGCGTCEIAEHLPDVKYTGFDTEPRYIEAARAKLGSSTSLILGDPLRDQSIHSGSYDIVLMLGVLHHIDDQTAVQFLALAKRALRPGGRLITLDGVFTSGQSPIVRMILKLDRGQHVRSVEGYRCLSSGIFSSVQTFIHDDMLRIPYTHIVMVCSR